MILFLQKSEFSYNHFVLKSGTLDFFLFPYEIFFPHFTDASGELHDSK